LENKFSGPFVHFVRVKLAAALEKYIFIQAQKKKKKKGRKERGRVVVFFL